MFQICYEITHLYVIYIGQDWEMLSSWEGWCGFLSFLLGQAPCFISSFHSSYYHYALDKGGTQKIFLNEWIIIETILHLRFPGMHDN